MAGELKLVRTGEDRLPDDAIAATRTSMTVGVQIVNYRTEADVRRLVDTLQAGATDISVFVYDNSGELLRDPPPKARLVGTGANDLFAAAHNTLYDMAGHEAVLLLNPDVHISAADVRALRDELFAASTWGVCPLLLNEDGTPQSYYRRLPTPSGLVADRLPPFRWLFRRAWTQYRYADGPPGPGEPVEQPPAACLMIKRSLVGSQLFDPRCALFFNDVELAWRLNKRYGPAVVSNFVAVRHVGGGSIGRASSARIAWLYMSGLVAFSRRHFPRARHLLVAASALVRVVVDLGARRRVKGGGR